MYKPHLTRTSIRTSIALVHVQSSDHLITRAIQSHCLATLAFIVQQSIAYR